MDYNELLIEVGGFICLGVMFVTLSKITDLRNDYLADKLNDREFVKKITPLFGINLFSGLMMLLILID